MAKIQLGSAPKTFKRKVTFPLIDGSEGELNVEFKYRTRAEFAAFIADLYPDVKTGPTAVTAPGFDLVAAAEQSIQSDVRHILGAVQGWDLTDPFESESVRRLANEFPAAAAAILIDYRIAITEGRLGN